MHFTNISNFFDGFNSTAESCGAEDISEMGGLVVAVGTSERCVFINMLDKYLADFCRTITIKETERIF
ncbi:unknown [Sutterella sp. CAG:351]|uniref:hypothetical protein n=1 Tax=Dakarella massiliensis TaxID=1506471 RepID=UPI00033CD745|nr:hypothetical protein [Dakarella massiliensis]CDE48174.1 unknown [Sutterella sp. CAG:351]